MAEKLERFGMTILHDSDHETPYSVVFNPYADRALSPADAGTSALVAPNCLWGSVGEAMLSPPGEHRALPYLVTTNPVNFGHPMQLTTVKAIATVLVIFGEKKRTGDVPLEFNWGYTFPGLNKKPLYRYAACADSTEAVETQREYLERGE